VKGLIVGETHPKKQAFLGELQALAATLGVEEHVAFLGHRSDLREIMAVSDVVYSLSLDPEAFGRVSLEALALGKPVVAYNHGGVAEQLRELFPCGLVPEGDRGRARVVTEALLENGQRPEGIGEFTLRKMQEQTLAIYGELVGKRSA
jgi:glycosyltransferase involved in cell wall biosynthesis